MILVDTSAWVEFDRATGTEVDLALTDLIASGADIAVTEPVLMEVLAGARDAVRLDQLSRLMTSFDWIPVEVATDFEGAADVYRLCRAAGITPRCLIDCMVASIAIRSGAALLAVDRDFEEMTRVLPLTLHRFEG